MSATTSSVAVFWGLAHFPSCSCPAPHAPSASILRAWNFLIEFVFVVFSFSLFARFFFASPLGFRFLDSSVSRKLSIYGLLDEILFRKRRPHVYPSAFKLCAMQFQSFLYCCFRANSDEFNKRYSLSSIEWIRSIKDVMLVQLLLR